MANRLDPICGYSSTHICRGGVREGPQVATRVHKTLRRARSRNRQESRTHIPKSRKTVESGRRRHRLKDFTLRQWVAAADRAMRINKTRGKHEAK